jgi:DNA-binding CsgD family transcriptional regulator
MLEARDEVPVPGAERAGGMALLRFATALCTSSVELLGGGRGRLRGYSSRLPREGGALVTVLELDPERPGRLAGALVALTPREREVAALVVDGLADREIAQRLYLSRHTVSQYVKRIYRKLGVDSRVALTGLLLGGRGSDQNL